MTSLAQSSPSTKPLSALKRLFELSTAYCASQAFFTACQLGLFKQLENGGMTAEELSRRLDLAPRGCERLLAVLRSLDLVEREGDLYRNTETGSYCTSRSPVSLEGLSMWGNPFYHMWEFLPEALREYGPQWRRAVGATADEVFAALYEDPERLRGFVAMTSASSTTLGMVMAEQFDFTPHKCILDVAGGSGGMLISIATQHPHLHGIVMDLPPVCELAAANIEANGLGDRCTTAAADLFAGPYPAGADVITLGYILHDWNDEKCRLILRHCFKALPSGGVLLVSEKVLNDDYSGDRTALLMDLHMLLCCESGARERSEADYAALLQEAGFHNIEFVRFDAPRDMIVARKP